MDSGGTAAAVGFLRRFRNEGAPAARRVHHQQVTADASAAGGGLLTRK